MKIKLLISLSLICLWTISFGQTLSQFYTKKTVNLEGLSSFAEANDWNKLFSDYKDQWRGKETGKIKHMVVAPDGSIFMSHHTHYEIWKFDKDGGFLKEFGSKGSGKGQFIMRPRVEGILGGKYVFTTDVQGRMLFFDFDGNYVKSLKLDYMPLRTVPLNDMKIAIYGHVPWKNNTTKNIISIKDFESGREKIIWEEISDGSMNIIELPNGKKMLAKLNFTNRSVTRFGIAASSEGNLLVASNKDKSISEFSSDGNKLRSFPLNIEPVKITDADIERIYNNQVARFAMFQERLPEERKLTEKELEMVKEEYEKRFESVKDKLKAGDHLPVYSTIITDSDGNILVFEFTEEKDSNKFNAYSYKMDGTLIGVSSFETKDYDLSFTHDKFVFFDGYIYALAIKKDAAGVPLRLVKFELL